MDKVTRDRLDWLKAEAPDVWWHVVEARIAMSEEDYAEYVAERFKEARSER